MPDPKSATATDAIELLKADHREVEALFTKFQRARDEAAKVDLVSQICQALSVHAALEERLFYPSSRHVIGQDGNALVDEAEVEHGSLKDLMRKLRGSNASSPHFEALVTVLKEYVEHHVQEEEAEFFPKVKRHGLDTAALGAKMRTARTRLAKRPSPATNGKVAFTAATVRARAPMRARGRTSDTGTARPSAARGSSRG